MSRSFYDLGQRSHRFQKLMFDCDLYTQVSDSGPNGPLVTFTIQCINSFCKGTKIPEFANSVELGEVAHYEQPHQAIHCLHYSF